MDARTGLILRRLDARFSDADLERLVSRVTAIVSAPRSGSTLLFQLLQRGAAVRTIGGESHAIYRQFPHLTAADADFTSGSLGEGHADPATIRRFRLLTLALLRDRDGRLAHDEGFDPARPPVIVEKTPRNALNLPFLRRVFPDARFVHLHRDPAETIASLTEAWETGAITDRFVTFRSLPGRRDPWCFLLPPGWQALADAPVEAIAAFQWRAANEAILAGLRDLPAERAVTVNYAQLVADPGAVLASATTLMGIPAEPAFDLTPGAALPPSASTVSAPAPGKWRARAAAIQPLLPPLADLTHALARATPTRGTHS